MSRTVPVRLIFDDDQAVRHFLAKMLNVTF
jgi:hypothetical protein